MCIRDRGEVIRYVLLMTHYRSPMDWTAEKARQAEATLRKWRELTDGIDVEDAPYPGVIDALVDDINTPEALAELHMLAKSYALSGHGGPRFVASARLLGLLTSDLGDWAKGIDVDLSAQTARFDLLRTAAIASKDFSAVDALKSALIAAGVEVRMSKAGVELVPGPDFDPAKLEALQ